MRFTTHTDGQKNTRPTWLSRFMDELRARAELGRGCFLEGCFFPDTEGMVTVREAVQAAPYRHHTPPRTAPHRPADSSGTGPLAFDHGPSPGWSVPAGKVAS